MRVTLEIDAKKVDAIINATKQQKISTALAQALDEFLEHRRRQDFLTQVRNGKTDYQSSNDRIEKSILTPQ
ncbi:hypothetical protein N8766_01110 [bacterium]|jgi:hypothetical protein|nr:hypothetical protein [Verrucomicrobiota bacterium]MDA7632683.1 hypothetical protein [bacterium]